MNTDFIVYLDGTVIPIIAGGEAPVAVPSPPAPTPAPGEGGAPPPELPAETPSPPDFTQLDDLLGSEDAAVEADPRTVEDVLAAEEVVEAQPQAEAAGSGGDEPPSEPAVGDLTVNERVADLERQLELRDNQATVQATQQLSAKAEFAKREFVGSLETVAAGWLTKINGATDDATRAQLQAMGKQDVELRVREFSLNEQDAAFAGERKANQDRQANEGRRQLLRMASTTHGVTERKLATLVSGYQSGMVDSFDLSAKSFKAGYTEGQRAANLKTRTQSQVDNVPTPGGFGGGVYNSADEIDAARAGGAIKTAKDRRDAYVKLGLDIPNY